MQTLVSEKTKKIEKRILSGFKRFFSFFVGTLSTLGIKARLRALKWLLWAFFVFCYPVCVSDISKLHVITHSFYMPLHVFFKNAMILRVRACVCACMCIYIILCIPLN